MIWILLVGIFLTIFLVQYMRAKQMQRQEDRMERNERLMEETMQRIRESDRQRESAGTGSAPDTTN